jgi:hypothetical protein
MAARTTIYYKTHREAKRQEKGKRKRNVNRKNIKSNLYTSHSPNFIAPKYENEGKNIEFMLKKITTWRVAEK